MTTESTESDEFRTVTSPYATVDELYTAALVEYPGDTTWAYTVAVALHLSQTRGGATDEEVQQYMLAALELWGAQHDGDAPLPAMSVLFANLDAALPE